MQVKTRPNTLRGFLQLAFPEQRVPPTPESAVRLLKLYSTRGTNAVHSRCAVGAAAQDWPTPHSYRRTSMTSRRNAFILAFVLVLCAPLTVSGLVSPERQPAAGASSCPTADSAAVMRAVGRFHEILSTGDTTGLDALLAPDLKVLEGGTVENRQEYLSQHLPEDIEFTKAVNEKRASTSYTCEGNVAWLVTTSTASGNFKGRAIDSVGAELMILSRTQEGWKIRAIHWSSARRQPR